MKIAGPLAPRHAAARAVLAVLERRQPLEAAFEAAARPLDPRDRALAHRLAVTVFRRFGHLTLLLRRLMDKPLKPELRPVEVALRLGLAQILFLDVPDHAAVDTAVRLVSASKHPREKALTGLVNAVLRRAAREKADIPAQLDANPEALMPRWYRDRLQANYGDRAGAIAAAILDAPPLDLTLKTAGEASSIAAALEAVAGGFSGFAPWPGRVRIRDSGPVPALPGYETGEWWVQDLAASLAAPLLDAKPGERIADLCAAPGGKTLQLAAGGADVLAVDASEERMEIVRRNLARAQLSAQLRVMDARTLDGHGTYDAVLIDAPCSATGTLRRHPEAVWIRDPKTLLQNLPIQDALLDKGWKLLKPGGRMVYCTCSLEPEEGEERIAAFLGRTPGAARDPIASHELHGHEEWRTEDGDVRTLPCHLADQGGMDGFFIARIAKREG